MGSTPHDPTIRSNADAVTDFTERLAAFQLDDWLAVAVAAERDVPARSTARAILDALIAHNRMGVQAWSVLDGVETIADCAFGPSSGMRLSRKTAAALRTASDAANAAGLALLARAQLGGDDFELLYQPFAGLVPL